MKTHVKRGLMVGITLLFIYFIIYAYRSQGPHTPMIPTEGRGGPAHTVKGVSLSSAAKTARIELPESKGLKSSLAAKGSEDTVSGLVQEKIKAMINTLSDPKISDVERNRIEHELGSSQDKSIDKNVRLMLEDGLLDMSDRSGMGTKRLISAIRIAGLRSDTGSLKNIIHICSHPEATEGVRIAGYEALGYMGTEEAKVFLREELSHGQDGFVQSQIVLSLGSAEDAESSSQFLDYLKSPDPDLRESAIIALGKIDEERAVPVFEEIYEKTSTSSRVLIVQALKEISTSDANKVLKKLESDRKG